jgi:methylenetetrahydrofolate reductase (NADPH)
MRIGDILKKRGKSLSFEFFPPKDDTGEINLFDTIRSLKRFKPTFVSVTYGAGGSTLKNTRHVAERIIEETSLNPMPHLTCINQSREELENLLDGYKAIGIDNILALRGDPPLNEDGTPIALKRKYYARDLVRWVAEGGGFSIGVGVYPEGHGESPDLEQDILYTKEKIDAGAEFGITQMFYNNRMFYDFMDRAARVGINVPIIAAIMPITDINRIRQFCSRCGASMPEACIRRFGDGQLSREDSIKTGIEIACEQCEDLMKNGVNYFHFYTLNKDESVAGVINNLGLHNLGME